MNSGIEVWSHMDETYPIIRAFKWVDETYLVSRTLSHLVDETHFDYEILQITG
jgi:hypothetical protein